MRRAAFFGVVAVLALGATACGGRGGGMLGSIHIAHPINTGRVASQPVSIDDRASALSYGMQDGTVVHQAALLQADAQSICFDVALSQVEDANVMANWEARVLSSTQPDVRSVPPPQIELLETLQNQFQGTRAEQQATGGYQTSCAQYDSYNNCIRWVEEPIYVTVYVPTTYTVYTGHARACWPNTGLMTPQTEWVRLRFVDPRNPSGRAIGGRVGLNFEWELEGAIPAQSSGGEQPASDDQQSQ